MNYYARHLGDYAKDTAHLSMIEHGAYSLLLDRYYATEQGIPEDQVYRVTRARSKEEKQAVDVVLDEFFKLVDGVWTNRRAEDEITKAQSKVKAAKENGKRGGRPKNNQEEQKNEHNNNQGITQEKPTGLFFGSENVTQEKALQEPITNNQKPNDPAACIANLEGCWPENQNRAPPSQPANETMPGNVAISIRLRELGVSITPSNPHAVAWGNSGVTPDLAAEAVQLARDRKGDTERIHPGYLDPIIRDLMTKKPTHGATQHAASQRSRETPHERIQRLNSSAETVRIIDGTAERTA